MAITNKSFLIQKKKNPRKFILFVGLAEFNDIEGPIISAIFPKNFPLDITDNYAIADYVLHTRTTTYFEINNYFIVSIPFTIEDPTYSRKARYYALILGSPITNSQLFLTRIEDIKIILREIIINIEPINLLPKNVDNFLKSVYRQVIDIFDTDKEKEKRSNRAKEELIIIDRTLGLIICTDKKDIESFLTNPENFEITITKRFIVISKRAFSLDNTRVLRY